MPLGASTRIGHSQARSRITSDSADPPCWTTELAARRNAWSRDRAAAAQRCNVLMTAMVRRRLPGPAWRIDRPGAPRLSESPDRGSVVRWCMAGSCGLTVGANHLRRHGECCSRGDRPQPERGSSRRAAYLPDEKGAAAVKKGESSACAARQPATPVARPSSSKPASATTARRNRR